MLLRAAHPEDLAAITALVERAYAGWVPVIGLRPAPMDDDHAAWLDSAWVLEADDSSVGGVLELDIAADHVLIANVAVDPARQGDGLGRRLLAQAEQVAAAAGCPELRLYTHVLMEANRVLYRRLGYVETEVREERGFARVFMVKTIDPALRYRPAHREDLAVMSDHVAEGLAGYRVFAAPGWRPPGRQRERAHLAERMDDPTLWTLLAHTGAGSAGHVLWSVARERSPDRGWRERPPIPGLAHLGQLFVREPWWGHGVAAHLHAAAVDAMRARGMTGARLNTPAAHPRARRFYEKRGWRAQESAFDPDLGLELVEYRLALD